MKSMNCGPCGLYCGACGATDCDGCLSDRTDGWVRQCPLRTCARDRRLDFCCHCGAYPCRELHEFMTDEWPHHWTMRPNLEYIKAHGAAQWVEAQEREWTCGRCGAGIFWYQKSCRCGKELDAWELPA